MRRTFLNLNIAKLQLPRPGSLVSMPQRCLARLLLSICPRPGPFKTSGKQTGLPFILFCLAIPATLPFWFQATQCVSCSPAQELQLPRRGCLFNSAKVEHSLPCLHSSLLIHSRHGPCFPKKYMRTSLCSCCPSLSLSFSFLLFSSNQPFWFQVAPFKSHSPTQELPLPRPGCLLNAPKV